MAKGTAQTRVACYLGFVVQATVINLPPLLFVTFQNRYGISLGKLSILISVGFFTQIVTDLIGSRIVDRVGYRASTIFANGIAVCGLCMLALLPDLFPQQAFFMLLIGVCACSVGGGMMDLLVSPIIESIPGGKKAAEMSLLHSFYCWGFVGVVLLSTLFFSTLGTERWPLLLFLFAIIPLIDGVLFSFAPIYAPPAEEAHSSHRRLFSSGVFWLLLLLMVFSGAAEQSVSQWASLFAEKGLSVSKTMGDLLGPCLFAACMAVVRMIYGFSGERISVRTALLCSCGLCICGYLLVGLGPTPAVSLIGCGLVGCAVALMWPGCISIGAGRFPSGGTALFALLALAGDVGCSAGPGLVGVVSEALTESGVETGTALKGGLLCAVVFPLLLAVILLILHRTRKTTHAAKAGQKEN